MFKKIKNLFLKTETIYSVEQIKAINKFKFAFRNFFEGYNYYEPIYETYISIKNFEIVNLKFNFPKNNMVITIILERPGILIGKNGHTIDSLKKYMNMIFKESFDEVELNIKQSKLWHLTPIN